MRKWMTLLAACCVVGVQAKVTLPGVFTDNMVVQQQTLLTIRGKADAGKEVTLQTGWTKVVWREMKKEPVVLKLKKENGQIYVTVPGLDAWNGGFINFGK